MSPSINPEMIVLARESRGYSQGELADLLGVSKGKLSKIEHGFLGVSPALVADLSRILRYPNDFFCQQFQVFPAELPFYRKHKTLTSKTQSQILAQMNILRRHIKELLDEAEIDFEPLPQCDLDEYGSPEEVAKAVRQFLRLPRGPIQNVTKILEDAGIIIVMLDAGTHKFSGASMHADCPNYIIFVNKNMPGDRLRFTLAHELGHIIMHRLPTPNMEEEADRFAAEFLMPSVEIKQYLSNLNFAKLASLKKFWKVSMGAIIKHAFNLGAIAKRQYEYLWTQMGKAGYRLKEPPELDIPQEKPTLLDELLSLHLRELGYSVEQISKKLRLLRDEFMAVYQLPKGSLQLVQKAG